KREIDRQRYARYPTVDVVGSVGRAEDAAFNLVGVNSNSAVVGVQLSVPLYTGGGIDARVREAAASHDRSLSDLENTRRQAEQGARQAYLGLNSGLAQVRALEAAERSSRLALDSNLLGYQVGVRINVDVLNAQQQLFSALRDLARARYDVLLNSLRLRSTAGTLQAADVIAIDDLLTPPAERMFPMVTAPGATSGRGASGGPRRAPGGSRAAPGGRQSPAAPGAQTGRRNMPR